MGAAVSAIVVAAAASAECWERISTRSCPSPQAASAERRDRVRRLGGRGREHERDQGEQAALGGGLAAAHLRLEREQPPERLDAGQPADQPRGGRLELQPEAQLPIEVVAAGRTSSQAATAPGSSAARKHTIDRPRAACARSEGLLDRRCASSMRPVASGIRAADSAAPSSSRMRPPQRGGRLLLERPAEESHRVVGCAAVAGASRGRRSARRTPTAHPPGRSRRPADERPLARSEPGPAPGARPAATWSCACSAGGIESSSACWMIGWRNRGGRRGRRSSASINASTASAARCGRRLRPLRCPASEASSPRIASARATEPTIGGRRLSRAATKRATDGGPMAAIVPASRLAGSAAFLERGDELTREQRIPAGRARALGADVVALS